MTATAGFDDTLATFREWEAGISADTAKLVESVLNGAINCYAFGRNVHSQFAARHLPLAGVVDDYAEPDTMWQGLPVIPADEIPKRAAVINMVLDKRPQQALRRLVQIDSNPRVLHYADFARLAPERCPLMPFAQSARDVLFANMGAFAELFSRLDDELSRQVMRDTLLYRLTGDPEFTQAYRVRERDQYFDVDMPLATAPVFVDGGGYHGETSEIFCGRYPNYAAVHLFEPNADSMVCAKRRLKRLENVYYHSAALGDSYAQLFFDDEAANASRITDVGGARVNVVPLDAVIDGPVHLIKFDLEGYEPRALAGACRTIATQLPQLAVCVYHHPQDFIDVPRAVEAAADDYSIRLRHYTEGWEETVMYFTRPQ